jgi:hypothetical protein
MRRLTVIVLLLVLAGCESFDWRWTGQALLQSVCYTVGNCAVACSSGEEDTKAQCE